MGLEKSNSLPCPRGKKAVLSLLRGEGVLSGACFQGEGEEVGRENGGRTCFRRPAACFERGLEFSAFTCKGGWQGKAQGGLLPVSITKRKSRRFAATIKSKKETRKGRISSILSRKKRDSGRVLRRKRGRHSISAGGESGIEGGRGGGRPF